MTVVRYVYFLGGNDPHGPMKMALHRAVARVFPERPSGRIDVKVINEVADEVMRVFRP
jgi:hypothetical protein